MNLESFKNATLGGSYGNPQTGTYKGQCVSYARKYIEEVLGIPTYPNGDAKDYMTNQMSTNFDKVVSPQNGDIVVYGAVPGNPYGHIGIYYNGMLLSQNLDKPLYVTIASLNLAKNRLGILRAKAKGNQVYIDQPVYDDLVHWKEEAIKNAPVLEDALKWKATAINELQPKIDELVAANEALTKQLADCPKQDPNSITITKDSLWTKFLAFFGK